MWKVSKYAVIIMILALVFCLGVVTPVQAASINVDPDEAKVGESIRISGSAYDEDETVTSITLTNEDGYSEELENDIEVGSNGKWSVNVKVPKAPGGDYTITAEASVSAAAEKSFRIMPSISLSKTSGIARDSVTVTGNGFGESEQGIKITFDSDTVADNIDASDNGSWSKSFAIPAKSVGQHAIDASGDDTDADDVDNVSFTITASTSITLSRTSGPVGSAVTITGTAFADSESGITVTFDGLQIGTVTASSAGTWSLNFTIQPAASGVHAIVARGTTTTIALSQNFSVIPSLTMNPLTAPAGATVTVTGAGFAANEQTINITYDGNPVGSATAAGPTGAWTATFTVPTGSTGVHAVNARGSVTTAVTPGISFTVGAGILINKTSGPIGTSVTVSGSGFAANEKSIIVTFDGTQVGTTTASATGAWSVNFSVPETASGDHLIDAYGATTKKEAIQEQTFNLVASVALNESSKTSGIPGTSITVDGSGFAPNEKNIKILFDTTTVTTATASAKGTWTATFAVPPSPSGLHKITVSSTTTENIVIDEMSFNVKPTMSFSPTSGSIGQPVTVKGSGFAASSTIQFTFDDAELNAGRVTTDALGNFSKTVTIPKIGGGPHTLAVFDGQNNEGAGTFTIDTSPPAAPTPESPAEGDTIGLTGDAAPTFRWSAVTAKSAVTYDLQIDVSEDFASPILEKTGLTAIKYSLTRSEALPQGTYFWRVRAVDAAGNTSEWSQDVLLKSGIIPAGILILIIVVVVIAIGLLIIFLLVPFLKRNRAKRQAREAAAAAAAAAATAPEIVIPEIVNAEYRALDTDEATKKRGLPYRLALPQAPQPARGAKGLSSEDQARLKVIIDFAKSLPLVEPGSNTDWLMDLAGNGAGETASPAFYSQLLKGETQLHYEPAWMHHPTFLDLQTLLEGQPILQDLNSFVEAVNQASSESISLLQDIYKDTTAEITWDILANGGWGFVSGVYTDSLAWFLGKYLREPSERDYSIKAEAVTGEETAKFGLYGEQNSPFAGLLVQTPEEKEAGQLRALHLKLRRNYRNSDRAKNVVSTIAQLTVQRGRLLNAFNQFNRLNA